MFFILCEVSKRKAIQACRIERMNFENVSTRAGVHDNSLVACSVSLLFHLFFTRSTSRICRRNLVIGIDNYIACCFEVSGDSMRNAITSVPDRGFALKLIPTLLSLCCVTRTSCRIEYPQRHLSLRPRNRYNIEGMPMELPTDKDTFSLCKINKRRFFRGKLIVSGRVLKLHAFYESRNIIEFPQNPPLVCICAK